MNKLENEIREIVEQIVEDARGKWDSHEATSIGIFQYTTDLANLISSKPVLMADAVHPELDLDFVKSHGGIPQDNENEGD